MKIVKEEKVKKNNFSKIDENDEGSDEDGQRKKKPNTTDKDRGRKIKAQNLEVGTKADRIQFLLFQWQIQILWILNKNLHSLVLQ